MKKQPLPNIHQIPILHSVFSCW